MLAAVSRMSFTCGLPSGWVMILGSTSFLSKTFHERVDKFIVKSNITSNKLQNFETVSRRSRHRSNHTQKNIPSVVAGHQFLQFVALARTTEYFLSLVIHPGFCLKTDHKIHFHRTAFSGPAACLWWLLIVCFGSSSYFKRFSKASPVLLEKGFTTFSF